MSKILKIIQQGLLTMQGFLSRAAEAAITQFFLGVFAGAFSLYVVEYIKKRKTRRILRTLLRDEVLYFHVPSLSLNLRRGRHFWKNGGDCHIEFVRFSTTAYDTHIPAIVELLRREEVFQVFAHYERIKKLNLFFNNEAWQQDKKEYLQSSAYALAFVYGLAELLTGSRKARKQVSEGLKSMRYDRETSYELSSVEQIFGDYGFTGFADSIQKLGQ